MTKIDKVIEYINKLKNENKIEQGGFIPSEHSLMIKLGFSRNTIRSALLKLSEVNILIPIQGKGYRYNHEVAHTLRSFKDEYGGKVNSTFVKARYIEEYEPIIKRYGYWQIIKVRYNDEGRPFILAYQCVADNIMKKLGDEYKVSLFDALKNKDYKISFAEKKIEYVETPKEVKLFLPDLDKHSLLLTSTTRDSNNVILEVSYNYYKPNDFTWKWIEKNYE